MTRDGFHAIASGWTLVSGFEALTERIEQLAEWTKLNGPLLPEEESTVAMMIQCQLARAIDEGVPVAEVPGGILVASSAATKPIDLSQLFKLLPTDHPFRDSPSAGETDCACSRCGGYIPEDSIPLRMWPDSCDYELRFCDFCTEKDMGMWSHEHEPDEKLNCTECSYPLAKREGAWKIAGPAPFPGRPAAGPFPETVH